MMPPDGALSNEDPARRDRHRGLAAGAAGAGADFAAGAARLMRSSSENSMLPLLPPTTRGE
jgi:hypothetical protein